MTLEQTNEFVLPGDLLTFIIAACVFGTLVIGALVLTVQLATNHVQPVLHWTENSTPVASLMLESEDHFHIFVSFVFRSGLQQAMALKTMLQTALPGLRCFFAVDNLTDISLLADIQRNRVLCMVSILTGHADETIEHSHYFQSEREPKGSEYCTAEFKLMLLELKRPVVCLLETQQALGGVTFEAHHRACPDQLRTDMEACPVIPFHREPGFKEATIRLVLQALLPCIAESSARAVAETPVYLPSEQTREPLVLPPPAREFHLYVSKSNPGAQALVELLQAELAGWNQGELKVTYTAVIDADRWLVHLSRLVDRRSRRGLLTISSQCIGAEPCPLA